MANKETTMENGYKITKEFYPSDNPEAKPELKRLIKIYNEDRKIEKNGTQKYILEEAEYKKGKIVNSNVLHYSNNELKHFHHKESYAIKNGRLEGHYEYTDSYIDERNREFERDYIVSACFKDGVLDGPFMMQVDGYVIKKGTFDKGVFHGEYNPNRRYNTKKAELEFCKKIQTICQDCLNPAQEFMASGQIESSKLSQVRKRIVGKLNKAAEKTGLKKPAEAARITAKSSGPRDY